MTRHGSLLWFTQHEARLAIREGASLLSGGRARGRSWWPWIGLLIFAAIMHLVALALVSHYSEIGTEPDRSTLTMISAVAAISWSLMLAQAMEAVTRAFYSRADLDLILSSPAPAARLFAVRIVGVAFSAMAMALVMAGPFINVLAFRGGLRWLGGYGVLAAMGFTATGVAIALSVALFRTIGPRRTRFVAQILAAVVGAAFVIGLQMAAILSLGTPGQVPFLQSDAVVQWLPGPDSVFWLPARAVLGDEAALAWVIGTGVLVLAAVTAVFAGSFGENAVVAGGQAEPRGRRARPAAFRISSTKQALRRKEWMLLRRDPWLASQTLMQLLYLLPPAFLLWRNLGSHTSGLTVVGPVLVMAAGQLAGGLAWLAVSGEDAPELIATAPATPRQIIAAKIEAVVTCVAAIFVPLLALMAIVAPVDAGIVAAGVLVSVTSATLIQLWFRRQAKRSQFRRRQTSSRIATIAEAFATIGWAGTVGLIAAKSWFALPAGGFALVVLFGVWLISPRGGAERQAVDQGGKQGGREPAYLAPR